MEQVAPPTIFIVIAILMMALSPIGLWALVKIIQRKYRDHKSKKVYKNFMDDYVNQVTAEMRPLIRNKTTLQKYCNHKSIREI